jgi:hypothetical protein
LNPPQFDIGPLTFRLKPNGIQVSRERFSQKRGDEAPAYSTAFDIRAYADGIHESGVIKGLERTVSIIPVPKTPESRQEDRSWNVIHLIDNIPHWHEYYSVQGPLPYKDLYLPRGQWRPEPAAQSK